MDRTKKCKKEINAAINKIKKCEHATKALEQEIMELRNKIAGDKKSHEEQEKEKEKHEKHQANLQEE